MQTIINFPTPDPKEKTFSGLLSKDIFRLMTLTEKTDNNQQTKELAKKIIENLLLEYLSAFAKEFFVSTPLNESDYADIN